MNEIFLLILGALLCWMTICLLRFWRQNLESSRQQEARKILKRHGLTPQLYLATTGEEDQELRDVLDVFAFSGHIVIDTDGKVVGRLVPTVQKGPHVRLAVSND